jgi:sec-independent protein translocase protein TatA
VSFGEIAIIVLFILLFFGSESIPSIARTLGRGLRQVRDATSEIKTEIRKSADKVVEQSDLKSITDIKIGGILEDNTENTQVFEEKKQVRLDQQLDED